MRQRPKNPRDKMPRHNTGAERSCGLPAREGGFGAKKQRSRRAAPAVKPDAQQPFAFPHYEGALPLERAPLVLETLPNEDYALLDAGFGRKLERYGCRRIIRPEGQALCPPALNAAEWEKADAVFTGNLEEEGVGRWDFPLLARGGEECSRRGRAATSSDWDKLLRGGEGQSPDRDKLRGGEQAALPETWPMQWFGLPYLGRFTSFRHVGVFPEQTAHWLFMEKSIRRAVSEGRVPRVLNLFGYTGLASLIAARAGAEVTHIDASKKAIGWAQENQFFADMGAAPIRWICEDALKFMQREERRGNAYDIILLDPPAYGRGPKGEVWQFFDNIAELAVRARNLLSKQPLAVILTAYAIRASFYALHNLMRAAFRGKGGIVESGELIIRRESGGAGAQDNTDNAVLSASLFSRWVSDPAHRQEEK